MLRITLVVLALSCCSLCMDMKGDEVEGPSVAHPSIKDEGPHEYELFPGVGMYKINLTLLSWSEAWRQCESEGAHLATVDWQGEYDVLVSLRDRYTDLVSMASYLGFHRLYLPNVFINIFNENVESKFIHWHPNHPSQDGTKKCGGIVIGTKTGMVVADCDSPRTFICEKELA